MKRILTAATVAATLVVAGCGGASSPAWHPATSTKCPPLGEGSMGACSPQRPSPPTRALSPFATLGGIQGVDISNNNGFVSFEGLRRQGIRFVYAKADEACFTDSQLSSNVRQAAAVSMPIGLYSFTRPGRVSPASDAACVARSVRFALARHATLLPVVWDVESFSEGPVCGWLHSAENALRADVPGVKQAVYGSVGTYPGCFPNGTEQWPASWGARFAPTLPGYSGEPYNWQWFGPRFASGTLAGMDRDRGGSRIFSTEFGQAPTRAELRAQLRHHEARRRALHRLIEAHRCRRGQHNLPREPRSKRLAYHRACGIWLRHGAREIKLIHGLERRLSRARTASLDPPSTYGGYSAWNPMLVAPGSSSSPFNQLVSSPTVLSNSGEIVSYVLHLGSPMPGNATSGPNWKHPTVFASNTGPVVELIATKPWGTNALTHRRVHVPAAFAAAPPPPSQGGDAHLEVVLAPENEKAPGEAVDLWQANPPSGGVLKFSWGSAANIAGTGIGGAATAADLDLWAGQVRGPELKAGHINHALCLVVKSNRSGSWVYPASHTDGTSSSSAAPKEGQRFYLAYSDSEIAALNVKPWKKVVLTALAHYGGYDCDSGGPGLAIEFESATSYTAFGQPNPFAVIGKEQGLPTWNGEYVFNFSEGVNWSRLRAIAPPAH